MDYPVSCVCALPGGLIQVDVLFQLDDILSRVISPSKLLLDQVSNALNQIAIFHIFYLVFPFIFSEKLLLGLDFPFSCLFLKDI